ncbi:hypothetical protein HX798_28840 [Pseudomonas putida]|uniref:Uncharacterized protein n=1 Tax=Pseudomonas putida TaxID=303 RepID=A0A7Y7ZFW6_PSEPU|nr:hypothetical protein [Pseudomonas putida]NWC84256.1 hypothetical protein [Pseudomonas putida]
MTVMARGATAASWTTELALPEIPGSSKANQVTPEDVAMDSQRLICFPRELGEELAELIAEKARCCGGGALELWEAICEGFGKAVVQSSAEPFDAKTNSISTQLLSVGNIALESALQKNTQLQAQLEQSNSLLRRWSEANLPAVHLAIRTEQYLGDIGELAAGQEGNEDHDDRGLGQLAISLLPGPTAQPVHGDAR